MIEITVEVGGMMCGMCEAHINDAVRRAFPVKKVHSSRRRGETVILTTDDLDDGALKAVIEATGYIPGAIRRRDPAKKGLFSK